MTIRPETPEDADAITDVTVAAFKTLPISRQTEQYIIAALREAGALTLSLVAELDGRIVGHIAFSPVTMSDGSEGWFGAGPLAVLPELHRTGIGSALMRDGLATLRARGAAGCCLVGDPAYYVQFGFRQADGLLHEGVPPEYFLVLPFGKAVPHGEVVFHAAFAATGRES